MDNSHRTAQSFSLLKPARAAAKIAQALDTQRIFRRPAWEAGDTCSPSSGVLESLVKS